MIKTVFTKSIKNSIDNINIEEDSTVSNKKVDDDKITNVKSHPDSITNVMGNENGNLISEGNSILLMINEIKDYKSKKNVKERMVTNIHKNKKINLNNLENTNISNNHKTDKKNGSIMSSYKTLIIKKNNDDIHKYNNKNNKSKLSTISKTNTYMTTIKNYSSIEKLVYSPKSKNNGKFCIQKGKVKFNKTERYLSPYMNKTSNIINKTNANDNTTDMNNKTISNNKNHKSIVVNINININTNESTTIANDIFKSPIHKLNKNKFPLSPLSPVNLNDKEFSNNNMPLSSTRNKNEVKTSNYMKIMKRKNDYNNLVLSTMRNKKLDETQKMKTLNSIDANDYRNKLNSTCNKDNLFYNKKKNNRLVNKINEYTLNKANLDLYNTNYNCNNKNVYFSPKIREHKSKFFKSMKDFENISQVNPKNYIYQKKQNSINSPLYKNIKLEKKFLSYKRLDNLENIKI